MIFRRRHKTRGATSAEYLLLVALLSLAIVAGLKGVSISIAPTLRAANTCLSALGGGTCGTQSPSQGIGPVGGVVKPTDPTGSVDGTRKAGELSIEW